MMESPGHAEIQVFSGVSKGERVTGNIRSRRVPHIVGLRSISNSDDCHKTRHEALKHIDLLMADRTHRNDGAGMTVPGVRQHMMSVATDAETIQRFPRLTTRYTVIAVPEPYIVESFPMWLRFATFPDTLSKKQDSRPGCHRVARRAHDLYTVVVRVALGHHTNSAAVSAGTSLPLLFKLKNRHCRPRFS
jgi:hypothetical protein